MGDVPITIAFQPGIQRDNTRFDAKRCLDSLWCRWRLGRPRKIGGFSMLTNGLAGIPRRIFMFYTGTEVIIHVGTTAGIQQIVTDSFGNFISINDRTPSFFQAGPAVGWTMDAIFDTSSGVVQLVAHAIADTVFLQNNVPQPPMIGQIDATTRMSAFANPAPAPPAAYSPPLYSGGICAVQPYVFGFSSGGFVQWSAPGLPNYLGVTGGTSGAGSARISAQKIVFGMALRGGGVNSPAALFWSLSELISATFIGGTPVWAFNTISPSSSILSSDSVIEYDGLYFWLGVGRVHVYNGIVVEVPNTQNLDWFYNNLTPGYEAKVAVFKIPHYGEIWWTAPMFGNTEASHALIYNVRENYFYDTVLPNSGRSCGFYAQGFPFPVMGEPGMVNGGYRLWLHETGTDQLINGAPTAVNSYFETPYFGPPVSDPPDDSGYDINFVQPDFYQQGDMTIGLYQSANARAPEALVKTVPLLATPAVPQQQQTAFQMGNRLARLRLQSNTLGGNYICGRNLVNVTKEGKRTIS